MIFLNVKTREQQPLFANPFDWSLKEYILAGDVFYPFQISPGFAMSEAHGERRHQQRPRGDGGEESRHRRNKESQGEHTRDHAKQVNTWIVLQSLRSMLHLLHSWQDINVHRTCTANRIVEYVVSIWGSVLSIDKLCRRWTYLPCQKNNLYLILYCTDTVHCAMQCSCPSTWTLPEWQKYTILVPRNDMTVFHRREMEPEWPFCG